MKTTHPSGIPSARPFRLWVTCLAAGITAAPAALTGQELSRDLRPADVRPLASDDLRGRDARRFAEISVPGTYEVPAMKAAPHFRREDGIYASQNLATLGISEAAPVRVEDVVDFSTLREPSPFRKAAVSAGISGTEASASNLPMGLALLAATYGAPAGTRGTTGCAPVELSVRQRVKLDPANVLTIVREEITAHGDCACEVVKAALTATGADAALTASIVEVAATAAPESMRITAQCAIATVPEALAEVQAVLARLDPGSGESGHSSKSSGAKAAKELAPPPAKKDEGDLLNPGILWIAPHLPFHPPTFDPPPVTPVNP
ncbi:hypothetical protein OVA24_17370 [Luteolibacter sp. SL250]|uniref:hypothetical protein n=1 Tax=Luteolibacter sp. SL250 TaxID=2995170 RepID=UPI00226E2305|nr:hypothetical protein [Luteolibacter sp. SL250]WAC19002.1 hypothetical protein OVA24_17370 [Luteolibacter sp. SL250]